MNARFLSFFLFNFFEFISVNFLQIANIGELPYGVLGTAPKFGSAKELNLSLPVYVLQTTSPKEIFYGGVRTGCKEKRAGRAKFAVFPFTYWAHCRRRHRGLRRCSQDLSICVNR